jgi:hypothetical protein
MAYVLEEELYSPKSQFVLEEETYKPPKTVAQKGTESLLSMIGPGADVAKGIASGLGGFGGSLVDLASALEPYLGGVGFRKGDRQQAEEFQKSFGREGVLEKLSELGVKPETAIGRTAERFGSYGPFGLAAPIPSLISAAVGQGLQELGAPEIVQLLGEVVAPSAKSIAQGARAIPTAIKEFAKSKPATLASGIEKPLAAEVPTTLAKLAKQTPGMQEKSLEQLGTQAEGILEKIKQKVPGYAKFAEGFDFKDFHEKIFGEVKDLAKNYTKPLKTNSITNFLTTTKNELEKIPNPTTGQKKSLKQINSFLSNPKDKLEDLLNVYRNLNSEIGDIPVTQMTRGKMSDYRKFLDNYKDKIVETFKSDLGPNKFNKLFDTANKSYNEYQNILALEQKLQPITGEKLGFSDYKRLANNKLAPKLNKIVGKELAGEIQGLARDVIEVQDVLKSVKAKDFLSNTKTLGAGATYALGALFPSKVLSLLGVKSAVEAGRYGLGYILTKPSRIQAFKKVTDAIKNLDFPKFKDALGPLVRMMESDEETEE